MLKTPFKLIVLMLVFVATNILVCVVWEWINIREEQKDMQLFISLASKQAIQQQQDLFLSWNRFGTLGDATEYNLGFGQISKEAAQRIQTEIAYGDLNPAAVNARVRKWAEDLEYQASTLYGLTPYNPSNMSGVPNPTDTDLFYYLKFLKDTTQVSAGKSTATNNRDRNYNFNPTQFGWTYVDPVLLQILFEDNLQKLIKENYGDASSLNATINSSQIGSLYYGTAEANANVQSAWNAFTVSLHSSALKIQPYSHSGRVMDFKLIKLTDNTPEGIRAYQQLFGKTYGGGTTVADELRYQETGMEHAHLVSDAFSGYVIQYDVRFVAKHWHNAKSPLFRRRNEANPDFSYGLTTSDPSGTVGWRWVTLRYSLNSGNYSGNPDVFSDTADNAAVVDTFASWIIPQQSYETNYILMN